MNVWLALQQFFAMGGYAGYVWPAFIIAALVLVMNWILPWRRQTKLLQKLAEKSF